MAENITQQRIIAVLGKRFSGKTTAAEMIHGMWSSSTLLTMQAYAIQAFIDLHEIRLEEFLAMHSYKQNRNFLGIFIEQNRQQDKHRFITPILAYIKNLPNIVIEDIFYFSELEALIKLGATIVWIDTDDKLRQERYRGPLPQNDPLEREVANMDAHLILKWPNTHIVKNDQGLDVMRVALHGIV